MWNACNSFDLFSIIQSSTVPCLATMFGIFDLGSTSCGVWTSTVRKTFGGPVGLFGSTGSSEKYSLRVRPGVTSPSHAMRDVARFVADGLVAGGKVNWG